MNVKHLREIPMGSPPAGALNTGGVFEIFRFLTNKSLYLVNDIT